MVEREEIIKLAGLSKLNLSDEQIDKLTVEMQSIISFADMISDAKTEDDTAISADDSRSLREDVVVPSYEQDTILKNAPTPDMGYFKIPRRSE